MFENGAGKAVVNDFPRFLQSCFVCFATDIFYKFDQALDNREKGEKKGIKSMEIANQIWSAFQTTLFPRFPPSPLPPHFLFLFFFSLCLLQALLKGNAENNIFAHFQQGRIFDPASSA